MIDKTKEKYLYELKYKFYQDKGVMMAPRVKRPDREIFNRYYSTPKEQEVSKYIPVAQELDKKLDDFVRFTSSPEEFKKALKEKFDGNIDQFNQYLILSALTLEYLKKAAEEDEGLKKLLSSLQEKRDAINKNMENIAKELGYTVSQYSLDKLMGKDLNGVMETLAKDFGGVKSKLEAIFSPEALNSLTDLFAFMVNKYPIGIKPKGEEPEQPEEETPWAGQQPVFGFGSVDQQLVFASNQQKQGVLKEAKQNEEYHSPLRGNGMKIAIGGVALGVLGGLLFAGSLFYPPLMGWGLVGIGLAVGAGFIVPFGVVVWAAGLIGEAWHNHLVQKAQEEALKEEKKRKKALEKKEKKKRKEEKERKEEEKRIKRNEEAIIKRLNKHIIIGSHSNREEKAIRKILENEEAFMKVLESKDQDLIKNAQYVLKAALESSHEDIRRKALFIVEHELESQDSVIRKEALSILKVALNSPYQDVGDLYRVAFHSPYKDVRSEALFILRTTLEDPREYVKWWDVYKMAFESLDTRTEALSMLKAAFENQSEDVRNKALSVLEVVTKESALQRLDRDIYKVAFESPYEDTRRKAIYLLEVASKDQSKEVRGRAMSYLDVALESPHEEVRSEALFYSKVASKSQYEDLRSDARAVLWEASEGVAGSQYPDVKDLAEALEKDSARMALPYLKGALGSRDQDVRKEALSILEVVFKHSDPLVRSKALSILDDALGRYVLVDEISYISELAYQSPYDDVKEGYEQIIEKRFRR